MPVIAAALLGLLTLLPSMAPAAETRQAWLVTYGPGAEMWERFGHNAIWLRDEAEGLDRVYSYGYFDMDRPGFAWDFARGIMIYEGAASDPGRELPWYRQRDRTVRLQQLDLDPGQFDRLRDMLAASLAPDQRQYAYDYFYNNCSTRLRDFLDETLDGALARATRDRPARLNFRDHTHRLTQEKFWLHTGMMMGLGPAVDAENTAWEEMFLPGALARAISRLENDGRPLVAAETRWHESTTFDPPNRPSHRLVPYALLGIATASLVLLPALVTSPVGARAGLVVLALAKTAGGGLLVFLWFSDHHAAAANAFLLLINPLWLLLLRSWSVLIDRALLVLLSGMGLVGTLLLAIPELYQFRPGPLLWVVPASLAGLGVAWRYPPRGQGRLRSDSTTRIP